MFYRLITIIACALFLFASSISAESNTFNVQHYGAVGDGKTLNSSAIQKAVDAASQKGGGTVVIPAGTYVSGPIFLKSNITLHFDSGAVLQGSRKYSDYPPEELSMSNGRHRAALISGNNLENIAVTGNGTIDGMGSIWWDEVGDAGLSETVAKAAQEERKKYARPRVIQLFNCKRVLLRDFKIINSPSWTILPVFCEEVLIDGIEINNPADSQNTDGIDPVSCKNIRISNSIISCGDDCVVLKSGTDEKGRRIGRPTENVTITNCIMKSGHGGVVIGSEMSGGIYNVAVSNCVFEGTERGIRIKTRRGRGGVVENISFNNIVMNDIREAAIVVSQLYDGSAGMFRTEPVTEATPVLRNISISNIRINGAGLAAFFEGIPEMPISGISLSDLSGKSTHGIYCGNTEDIDIRGIQLTVKDEPVITCELSSRIQLSNARITTAPGTPLIEFRSIKNSWITACPSFASSNPFLQVKGKDSSGIILSGNHPGIDADKILYTDVPKNAVGVRK